MSTTTLLSELEKKGFKGHAIWHRVRNSELSGRDFYRAVCQVFGLNAIPPCIQSIIDAGKMEIAVELSGIHPEEVGPHGGNYCVALNDGSLGYGESALAAMRDAGAGDIEIMEFDSWRWNSPRWPMVKPLISMSGDNLGYIFRF